MLNETDPIAEMRLAMPPRQRALTAVAMRLCSKHGESGNRNARAAARSLVRDSTVVRDAPDGLGALIGQPQIACRAGMTRTYFARRADQEI